MIAELLNESYQRAKSISIHGARWIVEKVEDDDPFFLITTHNPQGNALREVVEKHWEVLERSSATKQLSVKQPVFGYRWCPNLRDLLVSAKIKQPRKFESRAQPSSTTYNCCKTKNCRYCVGLDTSRTIEGTSTGRNFQSRINVTCKSTNPIYCITCKTCKLQIVGQTKGTIMDRFKAHFGVVNRRDMKEDIGHHFNGPKHHGINDMTIHALHFIYAPPEADFSLDIRLAVKFKWIHTLRTISPHGLNMKDKTPKSKYSRNIDSCIKEYRIYESRK